MDPIDFVPLIRYLSLQISVLLCLYKTQLYLYNSSKHFEIFGCATK